MRITSVSRVHYTAPGKQTVSAGGSYYRRCVTDERPYVRELVLDEEWTPVDVGWLTGVSRVVIQNDKVQLQRVPTVREQDAALAKVAEVSCDGGLTVSWEIPPGEHLDGSPTCVARMCLRCMGGETRVTVTAFPR